MNTFKFILGNIIFIGLLMFALSYNAYAGKWVTICYDDGHGPTCEAVYVQ